MPSREHCFLLAVLVSGLDIGALAVEPEGFAGGRSYQIVDGKVDGRTYNGYRHFHASCNHCHGPDGMGSTFGPSLMDRLPPIERFRSIVLGGISKEGAVMKGFAGDPNVSPHLDDIYAYLQARADGILGRGRPDRLEEKFAK
jgi:mono/diheme cytochrome c family protein